jgi:hypothetical protein
MLLVASILALLIGPLLFQASRLGTRVLAFLEGFAFITIAGLLLFSIFPHALIAGGVLAWVFALLGLVFPVALEHLFNRLAREIHMLILLLGVAGLFVHAILDGVALALPAVAASLQPVGTDNGENELALAIVLHRLPMGLAVWHLIAPAFSLMAAIGILILLALGTLVGFIAGADLINTVQGPGLAWFQAFVAGSILHVIVYEPGHHGHALGKGLTNTAKWPDRMGLICGLALLFVYL